MSFQFQCPQGHLLEGEESQAGQAIPCPVCNTLFYIPSPHPPAEHVAEPQTPSFVANEEEKVVPNEPELLHIPCPNGHELEVPPDMLDTEVLCPQCNAQFRLRARDSVEHKRRAEEQEAAREKKANVFWYKFSIGTVIGVVLLLTTLTIMSALNRSQVEEAPQKKKKTKPKPVPEKVEPAEPEEVAEEMEM